MRELKSLLLLQKFDLFRQVEFFYPLRSNGISSTHEVRRISSALSGLYIITRQRVSKLRNDDIQHSALVIYKDGVFDDIHGLCRDNERQFDSGNRKCKNIFFAGSYGGEHSNKKASLRLFGKAPSADRRLFNLPKHKLEHICHESY